MNIRSIFLVLPLLIFLALPAPAASTGEKFPSLLLADLETGNPVDVATLVAGQVGAIVFMQTSCGVCRKELLALKELSARKPSLAVVAVSIESGGSGRIANYRKINGFPFRFVRDPDFGSGELFGFKFTPGMVLTARDGTVMLVKGGFKDEDKIALEKTIDELTR